VVPGESSVYRSKNQRSFRVAAMQKQSCQVSNKDCCRASRKTGGIGTFSAI
jgi:hypothetical protein